MFTGLVEEVGTIAAVEQVGDQVRLTVTAPAVLDDAAVGDSIAVDGACLTVESFDTTSFTVTAIPETMQRTSLGDRPVGASVNIERAMPATGRFGGHVVQGHVDGTATIVRHSVEGDDVRFVVATHAADAGLVVEKGSITIGGVSLTVAAVRVLPDAPVSQGLEIEVALIPHTLEATTFSSLRVGDTVNIEFDVLAKYCERLLAYPRPVRVDA